MLTPEEQRELDRLELRRLEAKRAAAMQKPTEDVGRGTLRALGSGALLGFADNATAALTAGAAKLNPWSKDNMMVGGDSFGDIYKDTLGLERQGLEKFREERPGLAFGAEMAGGLATGGVGGIGRGVGKTALRRAASRGGVIAGESAVAGVGAGDADTLEGAAGDAAMGAGLGLGMSGVLKAAGLPIRALGSRNVRQMLENKAGEFTPIPLTGETGVLPKFYRGVVGRSWGGADALTDQIAPARNRVLAAVDDATLAKEALPEAFALERAAGMKRIIAKDEKLSQRTLGSLDEQAKKLDDDLAENVSRYKAEGARAPEALQEVGRKLDAENVRLRQDVTHASLPKAAGDLKDEVIGLDAPTASKQIKNWWGREGFKEVKAQTYAWSEPFQARLRDVAGNNPAIAATLAGDLDAVVPSLMKKVRRAAMRSQEGGVPESEALAKALKDEMENLTEIDGNALMAIRNAFARAGGGSSWKAGVNRRVKRTFDDEIRDQLKGKGLDPAEMFDDQIQSYRVFKAYDGAVEKAWTKKGGEFDHIDFLNASAKDIDAPMVGRAQGLRRSAEQAAAEAQAQGTKVKATAQARIAEAKQAVIDQKGGLAVKKEALTRSLAARKAAAVEQLKGQVDKFSREKGAKAKLKRARKQLAQLNKLSPTQDPTGLSMMLTTGLLGTIGGVAGLVGGPAGGLAGLALGTQVGRGLATKTGQKLVAGQTALQRHLAAGLRLRRENIRRTVKGAYRTTAQKQFQGEE